MFVKIALAQTEASNNIEANIEKGEKFVIKAAENGADVICFPELSFTKFFPQYKNESKYFDLSETIPGKLTERFQKLAKDNNIAIIINVFEKLNGKYFDSSPLILSDGSIAGKSHMLHIAQEPLFYEKDYYAPGETGFPVFNTKFGKLGIVICYDRHFPEHIRALVLKGAEIILIPQAGAEGNPIRGYEIEMMAASFTNQVFIGLVNRTGKEDNLNFIGGSFVTDPNGEIINKAGDFVEELLITEINTDEIKKYRKERPFLRDRRPELYNILQDK